MRSPFVRLTIAVIVVFTMSGAASPSQQAISKITLRGFSCLGVCPEYTLTFSKEGCIQLDGTSNFALIGHYTATIYDFDDVAASIESHGFFSMASTYPVMKAGSVILDARGTVLTVTKGGMSTTVTAWGDKGIPASFRELVNIIDGVALTAYWIDDGTGKPVATVHHGGDLEPVNPKPLCGCQPCRSSASSTQ